MTEKTILNHNDIGSLAKITGQKIAQLFSFPKIVKAYAIPRGGVPALYAIMAEAPEDLVIAPAMTPEEADIFVDDIVDSGETMHRYCDQYPGKPFFALIDKTDPNCSFSDCWVVFPWEGSEEGSAEDIPRRLLQYIGEDPKRGGLLETPKRFLKAWKHWGGGYGQDVASLLKVFEDGAENCDEMVLVKNIPVYSHCEHHLAPFFGVAHVGYIPNGKIVGLSKLSRLVDVYARRLQVQERLTNQIADALSEHLLPKGVGVVIECRHMCMESRGIQRQGSSTTTSAMRGVLREKPEARAEFMSLIQGK